MRIISGKFKNKRIFFPKNIKTRPLKDSVRENIFNILEHSKKIDIQIKNSNILDLYSGSGSFGLESLSRYANEVFFVEKDLDALKNLKKNIENFKIQKKAFLYSQSVFNFLENLNLYERFDLIFIDPPYADKKYIEIIKIIKKKNLLKKNHIIVLHREKKNLESLNIENFNIFEDRVYGRSRIFFGKFF